MFLRQPVDVAGTTMQVTAEPLGWAWISDVFPERHTVVYPGAHVVLDRDEIRFRLNVAHGGNLGGLVQFMPGIAGLLVQGRGGRIQVRREIAVAGRVG